MTIPALSPATPLQQLMWTGQARHPDLPLYNTALGFTIAGSIEPETLLAAFDRLVEGNEALRLTVDEINGQPTLGECCTPHPGARFLDLGNHPRSAEEAQRWMEDDARQSFRMGDHLYRACLFRLGDQSYVWYLNQHHLICDAQSCALLWSRLSELYQLLNSAENAAIQSWPPFSEHARLLQSDALRSARERSIPYWQQKLLEPLEPTQFYGPLPGHRQGFSERVTVPMTPERIRALEDLAHDARLGAISQDLGVFSLCTAVLLALTHRLSGKTRLRIGCPFHSRPTPPARRTAGLFLEIAALSVEVPAPVSFLDLARSVHSETLASLKHLPPGTSSAQVGAAFDLLVNFFRMETSDFAGLSCRAGWIDSGAMDPSHTLRLQIFEFRGAGELSLCFDLARECFDRRQRQRLLEQFVRMFDQCLADPETPIGLLSLANELDLEKLVYQFNGSEQRGTIETTAIALLERALLSADQDAVAVAESDGRGGWERTLTYRQLAANVDALSRPLARARSAPEARVAIYMHRSTEMLVGILAVMRAGCAYVPVDASNPVEHAQSILANSGATVLLTQSGLAHRFPDLSLETLVVDDFRWPEETDRPALDQHAAGAASPQDLAYVIFTSGSTGRPKGVMVEQRNLANYLAWAVNTYAAAGPTSFPFYSSVAFDLTVTSMFVPLLSGGTVRVYPEQNDGARLEILDVVRDDVVDVVKLTPSHLHVLLESEHIPKRMRALILGGEDFKRTLAVRTCNRLGANVTIYNEYGPTEATVGCMIHGFDPATDPEQSVPVGRPISGARVYVLDPYGHPVAPGVVGEMYLGGAGIARGYLGMTELTSERFVSDPFNPGERLYRSGDLARWTENARLQFLGRRDDQVKVGGVRLELGDVEAHLLAHPQVSQCAIVLDRGNTVNRWLPEAVHCIRCGIESRFPGIEMDEEGVCNVCRDFELHQQQVDPYFYGLAELREALSEARLQRTGEYDCLMLLSGGKDSTYALCQLVTMGASVLAFTLDNGYISDEAKANMDRVTQHLGVQLVSGSTPYMGEIFADSLRRFSNVCNGCFKTLYTLSMGVANAHGIPLIVTGIARGQLFETRLVDMFEARVFDPQIVDERVLAARKAYHQVEDTVSRCLDVELFQDEAIFERIRFLDFYRYSDVTLEEMMRFLGEQVPWRRPSDTGRSTNCLINDVGIYVHKQERGHHNYSLPYSWDVRLGHKTREAAMAELDDEIDEAHVQRILKEIGYQPGQEAENEKRLAAYYVAEGELDESDLRQYLATHLPTFAVPTYLVRLQDLPLNANGKVNRSQLPALGDLALPRGRQPRNQTETALVSIWMRVLQRESISIDDDFFQLGGDSISCIQVVAAARREGLSFSALQLFRSPTVAELASAIATPTNPEPSPPNANDRARKWISDSALSELLDQYGE